jgi:hypothetical protein
MSIIRQKLAVFFRASASEVASVVQTATNLPLEDLLMISYVLVMKESPVA